MTVFCKPALPRCLRFVTAAAILVLAVSTPGRPEDTAAQTVSMEIAEICVVGISGNPERLLLEADSQGPILPASDIGTSIRYTSTLGRNRHRSISARWGESDSAPSGCSLRLGAIPSGRPGEGNGAGSIVLSFSPQSLISGIATCSTGFSGAAGARLEYSLSVDSIDALVVGEKTTATVIFTLTDES